MNIIRQIVAFRSAKSSLSRSERRQSRVSIYIPVFAALLISVCAGHVFGEEWKAGAAKFNITPEQFMPMSGYAGRGAKHADGKLTDLWAKALVIESKQGQRAVLVTYDLIGIDRGLSVAICNALQRKFELHRSAVALNFSHTHTGPVVAKNLRPMHYMLLDEANRRLVDGYAQFLQEKSVEVVGEAIANIAPAKLAWGSGTATFAANRRNNKEAEVPELRKANELRGPFDHDVPVLVVSDAKDQLTAIAFGYACHNTTLGLLQWSGDYAGYAQLEIEKAHPGCIALYWAGCGGDQNPLPRRTVELAKQHGGDLAEAVERTVGDSAALRPIEGELSTQYKEVDLALARLPDRDELLREAKSTNKYIAARAKHHLGLLTTGKELSPAYPYPVQTWRLGDEVTFVFLGGEVVIDYAIRLKEELGSGRLDRKNVWVAGYSNDVMAYVPSRRVLTEGGYEGGGAMIYYGLPANWSPQVEETIVEEVRRQLTN